MMRSTRHTHLLLAALAVGAATFGAGVGNAHAQSTHAAAEHAKKAQNAYDVQNWAAAIQEYQAAYQADASPDYLWGLAQAQRLAGDCASAIRSYKAFKRNDAVTANQGTAAELQIVTCENELDKKQAEAMKKREVVPMPVGKTNGSTPTPTPAEAPAATAVAPATAPPAPRADGSGSKPFYTDVLGDLLLVAGVATAGIGTYVLLSANSDMRNTTSEPTYKGYDESVDEATKKQRLGAIVLGSGGLLVGLAVARYLTMSPGAKSAPPRAGFLLGPASVGYAGRF